MLKILSNIYLMIVSLSSAQTVLEPPPLNPVFGDTGSYSGKTHLFPVHEGETSTIGVIPGGETSLAARAQSLIAAQKSIRIQALIFTGDESGIFLTELLKKKVREGVKVRIIVDAFSNPSPQTELLFLYQKENGIKIEGYEFLAFELLTETPLPWQKGDFDFWRKNKRFHEKMWIVDAEDPEKAVAVAGGLNVANEYFRTNPWNRDKYWRDQDVMIRGPVVADLAQAFDENWKDFKDNKKAFGPLNPDIYWDLRKATRKLTGAIKPHFEQDEQVKKYVRDLAWRNVEVPMRPSRVRFFRSRPRYDESDIEQAYMKLIDSARSEILIANAYFVPWKRLREGLKNAARRGVKVRLLTNSPKTNDLPEISIVGRSHFRDLLAVNSESVIHPLEVWEWQGRKEDEPERLQGTMHSKFAVFDQEIGLVGSFNLDPRSRNFNSESAIVFENEANAKDLVRLYHQDLLYSRQISAQEADQFEDPSDALKKLRLQFSGVFEGLF